MAMALAPARDTCPACFDLPVCARSDDSDDEQLSSGIRSQGIHDKDHTSHDSDVSTTVVDQAHAEDGLDSEVRQGMKWLLSKWLLFPSHCMACHSQGSQHPNSVCKLALLCASASAHKLRYCLL